MHAVKQGEEEDAKAMDEEVAVTPGLVTPFLSPFGRAQIRQRLDTCKLRCLCIYRREEEEVFIIRHLRPTVYCRSNGSYNPYRLADMCLEEVGPCYVLVSRGRQSIRSDNDIYVLG